MSLIPAGISGEQAYTLENSLRFRASASAYLNRTFSTPTNNKKWTWSGWVKRGILSTAAYSIFGQYTNSTNRSDLYFDANDKLNFYNYVSGSVSPSPQLITSQAFRDPSAWYHIVLVWDSDNATAADRQIIYVNGTRVTSYQSSATVASGQSSQINSATGHTIGEYENVSVNFDGYMTEINFIDGQALDASYFGLTDPVTGVWAPKPYGGSYGTNGFYLPMTATTQATGFNTVLYTGDGASQSIGDVGFSPDLVWIKDRSTAYDHGLFDSVRSAGAAYLSSNLSASETTYDIAFGKLNSFDTDGFTVGQGDHATLPTAVSNKSGDNYVAWCWDAGDNQTSTGISSVVYFGNTEKQSIKGFGFSPDLVWIKARGYAYSHALFDSVRGASKWLTCNGTNAEATVSGVTSFDADGFTLGTDTGQNADAEKYVAWGWDAGDGDPVTNTQGTITSTLKASDATGFSIVTYTGTASSDTVGHGLATTPNIIIVKNRDTASNWSVNGNVGGLTYGTNKLTLQTSGDLTTDTNEVISANTTTFSLSNSGATNGSGNEHVAYCFSEVSGVSKFGSYTGNGSASGPTVTTGFRPGFLLIKGLDVTGGASWLIVDGTRNPFNPLDASLYADDSAVEGASDRVNFTDTGFEVITTSTLVNENTKSYLYMAFKGSYSDYVSPLNTDGDIDSRVKSSDTTGFSIVSYTGNGTDAATVGHGLTTQPSLSIIKNRDAITDWDVTFSGISGGTSLNLDTTSAVFSPSLGYHQIGASTLTLKNGGSGISRVNTSGEQYIAYCFSEVSGYSDIGTYTGTGSSGNSVTTGFRPAFVMIKCSSTGSTNWLMFDNTRDTDGVLELELNPNNSNIEYDNARNVTLTDTGFEVDGSNNNINGSSQTYLYMAFADTRDAQFNFDASGNKNNWTPNNINSNASSEETYDIMTDVPTLTDEDAANYPTWNTLNKGGSFVATQAGLYAYTTGADTYSGTRATIAIPSSGKWYWEYTVANQPTYSALSVGVCDATQAMTSFPGSTNSLTWQTRWGVYYQIVNEGTLIRSDSGVQFVTNDVLQVAYDVDNGKLFFGKNNNWLDSSSGTTGDPAAGTNPTISSFSPTKQVFPYVDQFYDARTSSPASYANFGQRPFAYTPPTGFKKLNTYNLPDSTIVDGSKYMNTVLYSGDGTDDREITGVGFQPDFTWLKARNDVADHTLFDVVRGAGSDKALYPNGSYAEGAYTAGFDAFLSDGFQVDNNVYTNSSSNTYAAWNWKAGGTAVSNSDGTLSATVSANTTSGVSIVEYTGVGAGNQSFGHGLGVAPQFVITKIRDGSPAYNWNSYHIGLDASSPENYYIALDVNGTRQSSVSLWQNTKPSSSVVYVGPHQATSGASGEKMMAWCFAPVEGFSAFGSYTGNGSTDGPFVYTGFRPSWWLVKHTTDTQSWYIFDVERSTYNAVNDYLLPNATNTEATDVTARDHDLLSNGFKIRNTNGAMNTSGITYIYAAFAENPFKNALAR